MDPVPEIRSIVGLIDYPYVPGEEQKKGCTCPVPEPKQRSMDRHPQESEKPPDTEPAEGFSQSRGTAQQQRPALAVEGRPRRERPPEVAASRSLRMR